MLELWEKLKSSKIASKYVQVYRIAGKVVEAEEVMNFSAYLVLLMLAL